MSQKNKKIEEVKPQKNGLGEWSFINTSRAIKITPGSNKNHLMDNGDNLIEIEPQVEDILNLSTPAPY